MSEIDKAQMVGDEDSRILALSDALTSENGLAISAAFMDVARSRGIAQMAHDAGLAEAKIYAALSEPAKPDTEVIARILRAMQVRQ